MGYSNQMHPDLQEVKGRVQDSAGMKLLIKNNDHMIYFQYKSIRKESITKVGVPL